MRPSTGKPAFERPLAADFAEYRRKRDFSATSEPAPGTPGQSEVPRFVIQRHDARSLHFDLRLEAGGVLMSWAVPKGVPLRTEVKRLAVQTEDHPLEYLTFAGVIPEGHHGAGRVTVWDTGTYEMVGQATDEWKIVLHGGLMRGEYHLVRTGGADSNQWLIFRARAAGPGVQDPEPRFRALRPMLPKLVDEPFDDPEWAFEVKWDGYRALTLISPEGSVIQSRSGLDMTDDFDFGDLRRSIFVQEAILDAEVVMLGEDGRADFGRLQRRDGVPTLIVFDILYADGVWLLDEAWAVRRELLGRMVTPEAAPRVRISDEIIGRGKDLFAAAQAQRVEGIVGKRMDSTYSPGARSAAWRKIKVRQAADFVIGGYTIGEGSRRHTLGSVIVGEMVDGKLRHRGQVGSGLTAEVAERLRAECEAIVAEGHPFADDEFPIDGDPVWVLPVQRCRVSYAELTNDGRLRAPVFEGMVAIASPTTSSGDSRIVVDGERSIKTTNLAKVYWEPEGITKGDLIEHYASVAEAIVPHLAGRAMVLKRYPDGADAEPFFQHSIPRGASSWLERVELARSDEPDRAVNTYVVVNDPLALLWVANLGCIDMNPWQSRADRPDEPTHVLFDLDPMDGVPFARVVEVAHLIRERLEAIGLRGYPKTTGGSGMHVFVPIVAGVNYEVVRLFALAVAESLMQERPGLVTTEVRKDKRGQRVYIDSNQNGRGRSISCVYSVRPRRGAPFACPLHWDEVAPDLLPTHFTIGRAARRLAEVGDLFAPVLNDPQDLVEAIRRLSSPGGEGSGAS